MGVPVSPRNIFPSNIQGLPTWYEVRVSEKGYLGRRGGIDMMVAMNPQTWDADVAEIEPGGYLFYDSTRPLPPSKFRERHPRDRHAADRDLQRGLSATRASASCSRTSSTSARCRCCWSIDPEVIEKLFGEQYKGKEKLLASNVQALHLGRDFAREHLQCAAGHPRAARRPGGRPDLRRRQQRRGAGLRLRRRHGGGLVSDHALVLGGRGLPEVLRASSASTRRPARTASPSCRPRTRSPPSAWWSARAGTARAPSPRPRGRASR